MINHLVLLCCLKNIKILSLCSCNFEVSKILKINRFSSICLFEECLDHGDEKFVECVSLLLKVGKIPNSKWIHEIKNKNLNNR